jgi:hypothetical protein
MGPIIRIRQGVLEMRRWGPHLVGQPFTDEDKVKWVHAPCASRRGVTVSQLKLGHCILCGVPFNPADPTDECVLRIERGHMVLDVWEEEEEDKDPFETKQAGYVHVTCAVFDGWEEPLAELRGS